MKIRKIFHLGKSSLQKKKKCFFTIEKKETATDYVSESLI